MGFLKEVKNSDIFDEFNIEEQKRFFSIAKDKFLPSVDNIYYSVFLKDDNKDNTLPGVSDLLEKLIEIKKVVLDTNKPQHWFSEDDDLLLKRSRYSIYDFCLGINGYFDIFITSNLLNNNTARIVVQIRASGLWKEGEYNILQKSYDVLKSVLDIYSLDIDEIKENRIDYCYHTNSIQNPLKYFSDKNLEENCYSSMTVYNKVGRKRGKKLSIEYLSLGNRKSNNVFFRTYNKVNEVIEKNYKDFFLDIWEKEKLISFYDKYVYQYAYCERSVSSIVKGKINFYLEYGKDEVKKETFRNYLKDKKCNYEFLNKKINGVLPPVTLIMNIEYQTMRKFYYYADSEILTFNFIDRNNDKLSKLYKILDNRKIFLNYLTSNVVSFRKKDFDAKELDEKKIYKNFWYRLRKVKLFSLAEKDYLRDYSHNLNLRLAERKLKSSIASLNLLNGNVDTTVNEDYSLLLNYVNDNTSVDYETGELYFDDTEYMEIKEKKKKAYKSILKNTSISPSEKKDN